ncbi:MAG: hypothetical protein ACYDBJ_02060 [Aggregatilineales bacterium]
MNSSTSTLDVLFDFCHSRQENPRWLCNQGLRAFVVDLPTGQATQPLIVSEREHVLYFSTRCLDFAGLDQKTRHQLCEYALVRNRSPHEVVFLATDYGLSALWACYRALNSCDMENNLVHYMCASEQFRRHVEQPDNLLTLLTENGIFQNETAI